MWQLRSISNLSINNSVLVEDNCIDFVVLKATEDLNKAVKLALSLRETKGWEDYVFYIIKVNSEGEVDIDSTVKYLNELLKLEYSI